MYDFLNLFRVIDFRDSHTAWKNRGGDFVLEFRKKRRMRRHLTQNFRKLRGWIKKASVTGVGAQK